MSGSDKSDHGASASRRDQKRTAILDAAQQVFCAHGYVGASMDQVAAGAAVSKQTVYKRFADKENLFRDVVAHVVHAGGAGIAPDQFVADDGSFPEDLRSFARHFLKGVMQPSVLELRRLVIAEAVRFPELGQLFYEMTLKRATDQLAVAIEHAAADQGVPLADPVLAAEQLLSLVLSIPLDQAMLRGRERALTDAALGRYAEEGVATFLRAYGFDER